MSSCSPLSLHLHLIQTNKARLLLLLLLLLLFLLLLLLEPVVFVPLGWGERGEVNLTSFQRQHQCRRERRQRPAAGSSGGRGSSAGCWAHR
jgi:hypothetical protein